MSLARLVVLLLLAATLSPVAAASCREACIVVFSERSGASDCGDGAPDYREREGAEATANLAGMQWTAGAESSCHAYEDPAGPNATSGEYHGFYAHADVRPQGTPDWSGVEVFWYEYEHRNNHRGVRECHTGAQVHDLVVWLGDFDFGCPGGIAPPRPPLLLS